ncbi:hypothetical protein [Actinobaculum suis]|uniref:hypothetical protein n=1 Tax=Actinobaculum suis TaxID=1657 RepID=UPI0011476D62|nr:hypothetical protein [Actinobaculum suis]
MGFFSWLFSLFRREESFLRPETSQRGASSRSYRDHTLYPLTSEPVTTRITLPADKEVYEDQVYVYDSSSYQHVPTGDMNELTVYAGDAKMTSTATGTVWDTRSSHGMCLLHRGFPIGFIHVLPRNTIRSARRAGIEIKVQARIEGNLPGYPGIRHVTVFRPKSNQVIENYVEATRNGVPETASYIEYFENNEDDYAELRPRKHWYFKGVTFNYLPVPEGSKAKPTIELRSAAGQLICRLNGRNRVYADVVEAERASRPPCHKCPIFPKKYD